MSVCGNGYLTLLVTKRPGGIIVTADKSFKYLNFLIGMFKILL